MFVIDPSKFGITPEMHQRYHELRREGYSPSEAHDIASMEAQGGGGQFGGGGGGDPFGGGGGGPAFGGSDRPSFGGFGGRPSFGGGGGGPFERY
jgi:hypothetical protein